MLKITVTIEEVAEKKPESIVGKYLIANSNFGDAYIMGIPCKIMSEPYAVKNEYYDKYIKVRSCITGIEYEIPYDLDWLRVYDTFCAVLATADVEKFLYHGGYHIFRNPQSCSDMSVLIGKKYHPIDNSYSENFKDGSRLWVADKVVTIVTEPYMATTPNGKKMWFVIVRTKDGEVGRCLFMEHKLVP